ncbi:MAG TPA: class I SAM-dependent methyltransferase [Thermodesulfobacteriota bacterium]
MTDRPAETWSGADAYERYVGRWSRLVAADFVAWLGRPPGAAWLDVGCGTGALGETVLALAAPARVEGVDRSAAYVAHARARLGGPRAAFAEADAERLPHADGTFDVVVSGLMLNFVARPEVALTEMARVVRPGGVVGAYVWDYAGGMECMRRFWDAAAALDREAAELDEGRRFPLCRPEALEALFRGAGLAEVASRAIDVPTRFRDFDDYWSPFLGDQGPAPGYAARLDEARRARLRERLRAALPTGADGAIDLVARAWAVRGVRPGA